MDISELRAILSNNQQLQGLSSVIRELQSSSQSSNGADSIKELSLKSQLLENLLTDLCQADKLILKLALRSGGTATGLSQTESSQQLNQFLKLLFEDKLSTQQINFLKSVLMTSELLMQDQSEILRLQEGLNPDFLSKLFNSLPVKSEPKTEQIDLLLKQVASCFTSLITDEPGQKADLVFSTWQLLFSNRQTYSDSADRLKSFDKSIAEALLKLYTVSISPERAYESESQLSAQKPLSASVHSKNNIREIFEGLSKSLLPAIRDSAQSQNHQKAEQLLNIVSNLLMLTSECCENKTGSPALTAKASLEVIKLAELLKSAEILRIVPQFLITAAQNRHSADKLITDLLQPLYNLISNLFQSADSGDSATLLSYIKTLEKAVRHNNKSGSLKDPVNHSATEFKNILLSDQRTGKSLQLNQQSENYLKDILTKLNQSAEKNSLPLFQTVNLPHPGNPVTLEVRQNTPVIKQVQEEENSKDKAASPDKMESLECSLMLPALGQIGIKINLLGQDVSVSLYSEAEQNATITKSLLPSLSEKLKSQGFKAPILTVLNQAPPPVKPEWMLKLLALKGQA